MSTAAPAAGTSALPVGTWQADPAHSSVEFRVKHMMIANVKGRFTDFSAAVTVAPSGEVSVTGTIAGASVDTNQAQRDEHLRSADFLDAATYPEITFASTSVTASSDDALDIVGDLTMHGVTRSVRLAATVEGAGTDPWGNERVAIEARGEVLRSDFGLTWNQAMETGGVLVGDRLRIVIAISAVRAAA